MKTPAHNTSGTILIYRPKSANLSETTIQNLNEMRENVVCREGIYFKTSLFDALQLKLK